MAGITQSKVIIFFSHRSFALRLPSSIAVRAECPTRSCRIVFKTGAIAPEKTGIGAILQQHQKASPYWTWRNRLPQQHRRHPHHHQHRSHGRNGWNAKQKKKPNAAGPALLSEKCSPTKCGNLQNGICIHMET